MDKSHVHAAEAQLRRYSSCNQDRNRACTVIIVGSSDGEDRLYDNLLDLLTANLKLEVQLTDCSDESIYSEIDNAHQILLIFNTACQEKYSALFAGILTRIFERCCQLRRRMAHAIKNFRSETESDMGLSHQLPTRVMKMLRLHELETKSVETLVQTLTDEGAETSSFSSPGESFAWQLATGFLSYILPKLRSEVQSSLLNDESLIRQQVLETFELTDIDPNKILIVPKYHLLLDEHIVSSQQSVPGVCPQLLFPGCRKVCNASTDLYLEFDSPGYKKRVTAYLIDLERPLTKDKATYTHALIFCGYAAPMFIMQKLSMSDEDKKAMFQQFRDELRLIQSHPRANAILREFSDCCSLEDVRESEPSALQVIDIEEDEDSLRSSIYAAIDEFLLCEGWSIVSSTRQQPSSESVRDEFPLMSMAFAMAANTWIGFAKLLNDYIQQLSSSDEQIPFDLPYLFVIPKSGRYPDESKLHSRFAELGVRSSQQEFRVSSGRRYTFRVHEWRSRRIAFEIPTCVLSLRKQAECSVGGIRAGDLGAHLAEFRDALDRFATMEGADRFKVVEWDDVTDQDESSWNEPSPYFAAHLLQFVYERT